MERPLLFPGGRVVAYPVPFATNDAEREFEAELEVFRTEVEQAKQLFYAYLGIDAEARDNQNVLRMFNETGDTAMLWNTIQYALQQSAIVALGRIFDSDSRAHGISRLVKMADQNRAIFTRTALQARKPTASTTFLAGIQEPTTDEFGHCARKSSGGAVSLSKGTIR
jgi:hypothetical protein